VSAPRRWSEVLHAPAFVINLDSRPDRLATTTEELVRAGFSDVRRFPAVNASNPTNLERAWMASGCPPFSGWDSRFTNVPGKQGCFLSHVALWDEILEQGLPFACVFEDDIFFHLHWKNLAPTYFGFTPTDYDILFMGNWMWVVEAGLVQRVPVYCMHAYIITAEGADRLRRTVLEDPEGVTTIDVMIARYQAHGDRSGVHPFNWYVWNGTTFPSKRAAQHPSWSVRNTGLVFQDHRLGTDIDVVELPPRTIPLRV
jgi:hypothetical protein